MIAAAMNLLLLGAGIAVTAAVALALTRGAHPRARYVAALCAFLAAAVVPLVLTFTAAAPPPALARRVAAARPAPVAGAVWVAVALLLLARELAGHVALARRYAGARASAMPGWPSDVPLLIADDGPCTIGLLQPRVVLPRAWLDDAVARHELAHARWRDPLVHAAVRAVRAILWPALPLWYLEVVIRTEREAAADAAAVREGEEHAYASTLIAVARTCVRRSAIGISGIGLEERIERLLARERPRWAFATFALLAGAIGMNALPIASAREAMPLHAVGNRWLDSVIAGTRYHDHTATKDVLLQLDRFRADGSIAPLAAALRHQDDRVRESSAWIAGLLGDGRAAPLLTERLADDDPHTREAAAWALRRLR